MSHNDDVIHAWHLAPGELPIPFRLSVLCWRFNLTFNKEHFFSVFCHMFEYLSRPFWWNVHHLAAMITNNAHFWFLNCQQFSSRTVHFTILPCDRDVCLGYLIVDANFDWFTTVFFTIAGTRWILYFLPLQGEWVTSCTRCVRTTWSRSAPPPFWPRSTTARTTLLASATPTRRHWACGGRSWASWTHSSIYGSTTRWRSGLKCVQRWARTPCGVTTTPRSPRCGHHNTATWRDARRTRWSHPSSLATARISTSSSIARARCSRSGWPTRSQTNSKRALTRCLWSARLRLSSAPSTGYTTC